MIELLVIGLMIACAMLFSRLAKAEHRLQDLEARQYDMEWRLTHWHPEEHAQAVDAEVPEEEVTEPQPEPQTKTVAEPQVQTVGAVRLVSDEAQSPSLSETDALAETYTAELPATDEPPRRAFSFNFEELVGGRLPIWLGGIVLAIAGVLIVRYSIETGLLTPLVRVVLSFAFGFGLLVMAELAYRLEHRVADERVRQALAGAGLATLYAAFYLAGTQYALIGQTVAFLGLAGVTALAIYLSYRFGLPSAVLGLVGGFAAPALVGGEDANLPMLTLYLALVTGGLAQTANRQKRSWLGLGALAGGLGWGALMLLGGDYDMSDIAAIGLYLVVLGALVPAFLDLEKLQQPVRLLSAGLAGVQLGILVDTAGYAPLAWALYLLLGAALAWFGWNRPEMRAGSAMAAAIGIVLLALWPSPEPVAFSLVAAILAALFAAVPLAMLRWKDGEALEAYSVAFVPLAIGVVVLMRFDIFWGSEQHPLAALGLLALAVLPAMAGWISWSRDNDDELATCLASVAVLTFFAAACLLPDAYLVMAAGAIAVAIIALVRSRVAGNQGLTSVSGLAAGGAAILLGATPMIWEEIEILWQGITTPSLLSVLRWLSAAAPFAAMAVLHRGTPGRTVTEFVAGALVFAALAQVLPPIWLVWTAVGLMVVLRLKQPEFSMAGVALLSCIALWAVVPLGSWVVEGAAALAGDPMLVTYLPTLRELVGFLLPLALALGLAQLRIPRFSERATSLYWLALPVVLVAAHVLFKQLFLLNSLLDFELRGLAERTVWQALLLAAAWGAWTWHKDRLVATAVAVAALVHFAWFSLVMHNPLWAHQAVGPVPIANLALAAYATAIAALLSLRHWWPNWRRATDSAVMGFALLGALTLLRQMFAGTFLDQLPMTQTEDLLRSLVGIVLAIVFLLIGSARGERLWRLGSLVLMTGTVLKVFIVDTAGLEGLLRIASFMALGASLIGIGWFYSRQLKAAPKAETAPQ